MSIDLKKLRPLRECGGCLAMVSLLLPVRICTVYGDGELDLCLHCRIGWEDSEECCLATTMLHRVRRPAAEARP